MDFLSNQKDSEILPFYLPTGNEITDQILTHSYREAKAFINLFIHHTKHSNSSLFKRMSMLEITFFFTEVCIKSLEQANDKDLIIFRMATEMYIKRNLHEELQFAIDCNFDSIQNYFENRRSFFSKQIALINKLNNLYSYHIITTFFAAPLTQVEIIEKFISKWTAAQFDNEPFDFLPDNILTDINGAILKSLKNIYKSFE